MRQLIRTSGTLCVLLTAACNRQPGVAAAVIDTLPGGIVRIRNHAPAAWPDTLGWHLVLEHTIHDPEGSPGALTSPRSLVASSSGEIFVLDRKPAVLKVYSPAGEFERTIGREGKGPAEFDDYGDLLLVHDTLIVNDRGNSRLVLFTGSGAAAGSFLSGRWPARWPATDDGRIPVAGYVEHHPETPSDNYPGAGAFFYRLDGTVADSMVFPPEPRGALWALKDATHDLGAFIPFSPEVVHTIDRQGRLLWGNQALYRIVVSAHGRDTLRVIEADAPRVPIPDSLRRAALADVIKGSPWAEHIAKLDDIPTHYPAWTDIRLDGAGNIWVLRPGARGPGDNWDVFDSNGRLQGAVSSPFDDAEYSYWTRDHIYFIRNDADGIPVVEVYRIDRNGK